MKTIHLVALSALALLGGCIIHVDSDGIEGSTLWSDDGRRDARKGSGTAAVETRTVAEFHAIELRGAADVRARVGTPAKVEVTTDDNLLEFVRTEVRDGVLVIEMQPGRYAFKNGLCVDLVTPSLDAVSVSGSGDVELSDVAGKSLTLGLSGSGDIRASGTVGALVVSLSGSGDLDLSNLAATSARAQISGSGDIDLAVSERLDVVISGSGDVSYRGSPQVVSQVTGSGAVRGR